MFCKNCGKELSEGARFCSHCGCDNGTGNDIEKKIENDVKNFSESIDKQFENSVNEIRSDINGTKEPGVNRLRTDRGLIMYILLSIITCGIYSYYFIYTVAKDINVACENDGENTGGLATFIIFSILTCGIYGLYWQYKLANRIQANGPRYNLNIVENGTSVLLWYIFGMLLCFIGPYVAMHIIIKNTNMICDAYNKSKNLY